MQPTVEPRAGRPPRVYRVLNVQRVERITPHMVRVTVAGDALAGYAPNGPAEHIRVFFPPAGQDALGRPEFGPNGIVYPEGQAPEAGRVYTPRRWDAAAQELEFEVALHGHGPGASWAARVEPGSPVVLTGPGGPYRMDPSADWYLLAGDESALPAIADILETLPADKPVYVFAEVPAAEDVQELGVARPGKVTWLQRDADSGPAGRLLEAAIRSFPLPEGNGRVWTACEAEVMRDIRKHLLFERGLDRKAIHTHGYWKQGAVNHPDHDLGEEI